MAKYNTKAVNKTKTTNLAGGEAFKQPAKVELISHLLTSFAGDKFYATEAEQKARLRELLLEVDPVFAAKAAVYARNEFGMRSISHIVAGELAHMVKGQSWTKHFIEKVVRRPDDMTEIVAYYMGNHGKPVPNSLKKGLAAAFEKFDGYQLAKYRGEGKAVSLVDVVNLVHPRPTAKNAEALSGLVNGTLKSTDTWEAKLSEAGKAEDKDAAKAESWGELITTRKIGYFALLRNLRNIAEQAPAHLDGALDLLVDEKLIRKSLVLPFRFLTAYNEIADSSLAGKQKIMRKLSQALDISVANVPEFDGMSLVALDSSGSMLSGGTYGYYAGNKGRLDPKAPAVIGAVFMAALLKKNPDNTDLMDFSSDAKYLNIDASDSVLSIARQIVSTIQGYATNTPAVFNRANKKYDRVIILSDMQTWVSNGYSYGASSGVTPAYNAYSKKYGQPKVYTMDLAGHGTSNLSQDKVYQLAGFSEKVFDLMKLLETDRNAMVKAVEAVEL